MTTSLPNFIVPYFDMVKIKEKREGRSTTTTTILLQDL
jgi:hypothetical protein